MLASLSRRPGYQHITEIPRFDFLKQVHVLLTCHRRDSFGSNELTIYRLQTRFRQPGSKKDKLPSGRPWLTTPLEVRAIMTLA